MPTVKDIVTHLDTLKEEYEGLRANIADYIVPINYVVKGNKKRPEIPTSSQQNYTCLL